MLKQIIFSCKNSACRKWNFKITSISTSLVMLISSITFDLPAKAGLFDGFGGRCGSTGEGHVTVTNDLRTKVYVLTEKNDASGGPDGRELSPGESNRTPICNYNGIRVKVYTSEDCGKTFLSESRFDRVYNEEQVYIKPNGFTFGVGDALDVGSRVAGVALTYLAAGYGIPPEALSAMGVNEAEVTGACLQGGIGCARALYNYRDKLPSDLFTTINADKCLSRAFAGISAGQQTVGSCPPSYSPAAFQGRTAKVAFANEWSVPITVVLYHPSNRSIFGRYTVSPGQNSFLGNNVVVGDDWGVCFENKPTTSGFVNNLGVISDYNNFQGSFLFQIQNPRSR